MKKQYIASEYIFQFKYVRSIKTKPRNIYHKNDNALVVQYFLLFTIIKKNQQTIYEFLVFSQVKLQNLLL
jgi:hypothetical protein